MRRLDDRLEALLTEAAYPTASARRDARLLFGRLILADDVELERFARGVAAHVIDAEQVRGDGASCEDCDSLEKQIARYERATDSNPGTHDLESLVDEAVEAETTRRACLDKIQKAGLPDHDCDLLEAVVGLIKEATGDIAKLESENKAARELLEERDRVNDRLASAVRGAHFNGTGEYASDDKIVSNIEAAYKERNTFRRLEGEKAASLRDMIVQRNRAEELLDTVLKTLGVDEEFDRGVAVELVKDGDFGYHAKHTRQSKEDLLDAIAKRDRAEQRCEELRGALVAVIAPTMPERKVTTKTDNDASLIALAAEHGARLLRMGRTLRERTL